MYDLTNEWYSHSEMMNILRTNRTVSYRYALLDKDENTIGEVSANGSIDFNSAATIKRAASFEIAEIKDINYLSDRIKPYMRITTPKGIVEYPLGIFLMSSPSRKASNGIVTRSIDCYDKMQILVDDKLDNRLTFQSGTNYVAAVRTVLQSAGINESDIEDSNKEMEAAIEFSLGESKAEIISKLLNAINYTDLWVDARGKFRAGKYTGVESRLVEASYLTDKNSITLSGAEENLDIFEVPNKIVRYLESADRDCIIASIVNSNPASKLSTVNRGRVIADVEAVSDIADEDTLKAYVSRLAEQQNIYQTITFNTACMPMHEYLDCLFIQNHELDISGKYIETAWSMQLKTGGTMSHAAKRTVSI